MPRPHCPQGEGLIYHTLNRGNNRQAVFEDEEDFAVYLHALGQTKSRYLFRLYGYVLMTMHTSCSRRWQGRRSAGVEMLRRSARGR
jgi:putative transposase